MSGTVAIIAQDNNRYTMFWVSFLKMLSRAPKGTRWDIGISTAVPEARNHLVQRALEAGSEWILFVDDDQVFGENLVNDLLAHDVDIVSALYLHRAGAHDAVAFSELLPGNLYRPLDLTRLPGEGLLKVRAVGAGGLLVRSHVFEQVSDDPDWFAYGHMPGREWNASEDIIFCERAQEAGFDIYVDLGSPIGHMAPSAIWPSYVDGEWCFGFSVSDATKLIVPIESPAEVDTAPADAVRR